MSDDTSPDTFTPLGQDPLDTWISLADTSRLLSVRHSQGYNAFIAHVRIARDKAADTKAREEQAAARLERSREHDQRRYLDSHAPAISPLMFDWSAFPEATKKRLRAITCPIDLAVQVGEARRAAGLDIPTVRGPVDEVFNQRLSKLKQEAETSQP